LGKGLAGESATQRATKIAAGGFPVSVGVAGAIQLKTPAARTKRKSRHFRLDRLCPGRVINNPKTDDARCVELVRIDRDFFEWQWWGDS
jgi:hypothetical protein